MESMMNKNLLIIGAGDYGQIAYEIAEAMEKFEKIDFLDDNSELAIGKVSDIENLAGQYSFGIVAIGNPEIRSTLTKRLEENCYKIPVLIHPKAFVGKYATIRKGCIIEPMAVVNSGTEVSEGTIISAGAIINHSVLVGAFSHINIGAIVRAHSALPMFTKVDEGAIYHGINLVYDLKNDKNCTDDFRAEYAKKYGKEPNLFDGD